MSQPQSAMDHPLMSTSSSASTNTSTIPPNPLTSPTQQPTSNTSKANNKLKSNTKNNQNTNNKYNISTSNNQNQNQNLNNNMTIPLILPLQTSLNTNNNNIIELKMNDNNTVTTSKSKSTTKTKTKSIFERNLNVGRSNKVSLSAFSYLFCELLLYSQKGVKNTTELEERLSNIGYSVGYKQLELMTYRISPGRRHRDVIGMLEFIKDKVWKHLFGRTADGLEQSTTNKNEFFIIDHNPITNRYVSVPDHLGDFNAASFIGGIIHGILDSSGFPCNVITHEQLPSKEQPKKRTIFIVQIKPKKKHGASIK